MRSFNYEELSLMRCYNPENGRLSMIAMLNEVLPDTKNKLAIETIRNILGKLHTISDEEFDTLDFVNVFE